MRKTLTILNNRYLVLLKLQENLSNACEKRTIRLTNTVLGAAIALLRQQRQQRQQRLKSARCSKAIDSKVVTPLIRKIGRSNNGRTLGAVSKGSASGGALAAIPAAC
jgi:hypothetical protein